MNEIDNQIYLNEKDITDLKTDYNNLSAQKQDVISDLDEIRQKANSAIQEHQSLEGYATETWVEGKGYLTGHQSLTGYLKTGDVPDWAKASTKPTYTASEVGALPSDTVIPEAVTDDHINDLIEAKLSPIEASAQALSEVIG